MPVLLCRTYSTHWCLSLYCNYHKCCHIYIYIYIYICHMYIQAWSTITILNTDAKTIKMTTLCLSRYISLVNTLHHWYYNLEVTISVRAAVGARSVYNVHVCTL